MNEEQLEELRSEILAEVKKGSAGFQSSLEDISKRLDLTDLNNFSSSERVRENIRRIVTSTDAYIITVFGKDQDVFAVDGRGFVSIALKTNGKTLSRVFARHLTAGSGAGNTTIQVRNETEGVNMLSTAITIDSGETSSETATTQAVIDSANSSVSTNDLIYANVSAIPANAPKGLQLVIEFE